MGATLFISCGGRRASVAPPNADSLITMQSTDLTVVYSANGLTSYRFETPLLERYEMAAEPYMEFRQGIHMTTYNDSTEVVESTLVADYAKYLERQQLWEARGRVVAVNAEGRKLETEQLFWNEKTDRIYSVVPARMTEGEDVTTVEDFETNSAFDDYRFRSPLGQMAVDTEPNRDSTALVTPVDSLSP